MEKKPHLIQFKIYGTDTVLYELYDRIQEEGKGQKGYVTESIRTRLRFFEALSKMVNEEDPVEVLQKLIKRWYAQLSDSETVTHSEVKIMLPVVEQKVDKEMSWIANQMKGQMDNLGKLNNFTFEDDEEELELE